MYTDKKNILQLVALLKEHSISKIVLCPGSRNSPIVHTLANHPFFTCYSVTDERSADSLPWVWHCMEENRQPVCCTSGTALLNLHRLWRKLLPTCSSYRHIGRPSGSLDRPNGRTDFTTTGRIRFPG